MQVKSVNKKFFKFNFLKSSSFDWQNIYFSKNIVCNLTTTTTKNDNKNTGYYQTTITIFSVLWQNKRQTDAKCKSDPFLCDSAEKGHPPSSVKSPWIYFLFLFSLQVFLLGDVRAVQIIITQVFSFFEIALRRKIVSSHVTYTHGHRRASYKIKMHYVDVDYVDDNEVMVCSWTWSRWWWWWWQGKKDFLGAMIYLVLMV